MASRAGVDFEITVAHALSQRAGQIKVTTEPRRIAGDLAEAGMSGWKRPAEKGACGHSRRLAYGAHGSAPLNDSHGRHRRAGPATGARVAAHHERCARVGVARRGPSTPCTTASRPAWTAWSPR